MHVLLVTDFPFLLRSVSQLMFGLAGYAEGLPFSRRRTAFCACHAPKIHPLGVSTTLFGFEISSFGPIWERVSAAVARKFLHAGRRACLPITIIFNSVRFAMSNIEALEARMNRAKEALLGYVEQRTNLDAAHYGQLAALVKKTEAAFRKAVAQLGR